MNSDFGATQIENSPTAAVQAEGGKVPPQTLLMEKLTPILETLGYELVHLEMQMHHGKVLRVYIDRLDSSEAIGVEDCANVSRALDEPLEAMPAIDQAFGGAYELEVSSPGIDRPLRKIRDFEKFAGRDARIHTFRALTSEELGNSDYQKRNPKQKNFLGVLNGVTSGSGGAFSVKLTVLASMGTSAKEKNSRKNTKENERKDEILLPMVLISKANIEPHLDF